MKEFWTVYIMKDQCGNVLYVGRTIRPASRIKQHSKDKEWFNQVSFIELRHFRSFSEMTEAEISLIDELNPKWNVIYVPDEMRVLRPADAPECLPLKEIEKMLQGRNVKKLAELCGLNRNLISQIKRGKNPNITRKTQRKLSEYLAPRNFD